MASGGPSASSGGRAKPDDKGQQVDNQHGNTKVCFHTGGWRANGLGKPWKMNTESLMEQVRTKIDRNIDLVLDCSSQDSPTKHWCPRERYDHWGAHSDTMCLVAIESAGNVMGRGPDIKQVCRTQGKR